MSFPNNKFGTSVVGFIVGSALVAILSTFQTNYTTTCSVSFDHTSPHKVTAILDNRITGTTEGPELSDPYIFTLMFVDNAVPGPMPTPTPVQIDPTKLQVKENITPAKSGNGKNPTPKAGSKTGAPTAKRYTTRSVQSWYRDFPAGSFTAGNTYVLVVFRADFCAWASLTIIAE